MVLMHKARGGSVRANLWRERLLVIVQRIKRRNKVLSLVCGDSVFLRENYPVWLKFRLLISMKLIVHFQSELSLSRIMKPLSERSWVLYCWGIRIPCARKLNILVGAKVHLFETIGIEWIIDVQRSFINFSNHLIVLVLRLTILIPRAIFGRNSTNNELSLFRLRWGRCHISSEDNFRKVLTLRGPNLSARNLISFQNLTMHLIHSLLRWRIISSIRKRNVF